MYTKLYQVTNAIEKDQVTVKRYLDIYPEYIQYKNEVGDTLLHYAVIHSTVITLLLLERGAMVNERNDNGETPLMWAVSSGNAATVEILLRHGAITSYTEKLSRSTALVTAARYGYVDIVKMLLTAGANPHEFDIENNRPVDVAYDACTMEVLGDAMGAY